MYCVRPESTGWRDEAISKEHRRWGWNMPCFDIDWLVVESLSHKPKVIVEYKRVASMPCRFDLDTPQVRTLAHLAHRHEDRLPLFIVHYMHSSDRLRWSFEVMTIAAEDEPKYRGIMTAAQYVAFLSRFKGQEPDQGILATLSQTLDDRTGPVSNSLHLR